MALRAEAAHEAGREGVFATKTWLESTTHIELMFDAYRFSSQCTVSCLDGSLQTFDLFGQVISRQAALYVENKTYTTPGSQAADFDDFLCIAYSFTAAEAKRVSDPKAEFMWVTTHPFLVTEWTTLTSRERIETALKNDKTNILGGQAVDPKILTLVSERVWLLVLSKRQHELTLTAAELSNIEAILNRKGR